MSLHICRICLQSGTQAERLGLEETTGTGGWILPQDGAQFMFVFSAKDSNCPNISKEQIESTLVL